MGPSVADGHREGSLGHLTGSQPAHSLAFPLEEVLIVAESFCTLKLRWKPVWEMVWGAKDQALAYPNFHGFGEEAGAPLKDKATKQLRRGSMP